MAANPQPQPNPPKRNRPTTPLNPNFSEQVYAAESANRERDQVYRQKRARRRKLIGAVGAGALLLLVGQLIFAIQKYNSANTQLNDMTRQLNKAKATNKSLRSDLKKLKDPDYQERVLRDKYQYTKKGEIIYNLPDSAD